MSELTIGDKAPDFTLATDGGGSVTLSDLQGKKVVLFFYPKDDTGGCTKEAIGFTEKMAEFDAANTMIIGLSADSADSHDKFKAKFNLGVMLAADEDLGALKAYGVWVEKNNYGNKTMGIERTTYLIDESGNIAHVWPNVSVPGHVEEVLAQAQA